MREDEERSKAGMQSKVDSYKSKLMNAISSGDPSKLQALLDDLPFGKEVRWGARSEAGGEKRRPDIYAQRTGRREATTYYHTLRP